MFSGRNTERAGPVEEEALDAIELQEAVDYGRSVLCWPAIEPRSSEARARCGFEGNGRDGMRLRKYSASRNMIAMMEHQKKTRTDSQQPISRCDIEWSQQFILRQLLACQMLDWLIAPPEIKMNFTLGKFGPTESCTVQTKWHICPIRAKQPSSVQTANFSA